MYKVSRREGGGWVMGVSEGRWMGGGREGGRWMDGGRKMEVDGLWEGGRWVVVGGRWMDGGREGGGWMVGVSEGRRMDGGSE